MLAYWLTGSLFWPHNGMVFHWHLVQNFHPFPDILSKIQSDPFPLGYSDFSSKDLGKYAIWVYGEKYSNIAIWFRTSPRFQSCYRKFNPTLLRCATAFFSSNGLRKYTIWVYGEKYLKIARLFRFSPRFQKWYSKFNPTLFHWAKGFFFKNGLAGFFLKVSTGILKVPFLHRKNIFA